MFESNGKIEKLLKRLSIILKLKKKKKYFLYTIRLRKTNIFQTKIFVDSNIYEPVLIALFLYLDGGLRRAGSAGHLVSLSLLFGLITVQG